MHSEQEVCMSLSVPPPVSVFAAAAVTLADCPAEVQPQFWAACRVGLEAELTCVSSDPWAAAQTRQRRIWAVSAPTRTDSTEPVNQNRWSGEVRNKHITPFQNVAQNQS